MNTRKHFRTRRRFYFSDLNGNEYAVWTDINA